MKKLIIIQTTAPDYRADFYKNIQSTLKEDFNLYAGNYYFEKSVKSDKNIKKSVVKNYFLFRRKILFQTGIWHLLFKKDIIVLEMNPRIISNWVFLIVRKLTFRQTVLWGHAWPRNGKKSKSDFLRNLMRHLAKKIIVYTKKQRDELKEKMTKKTIIAAPNAVINASKMITEDLDSQTNIIYVGRLTKLKKPLFLVKAFGKGIHKFPKNTKLIIVGDGEEKETLIKYIDEHDLNSFIQLKGHINNYETLKKLYANSFFSVSPGYVGLSITQSFGFGVPMLVSKTENHSPEIEAVIVNENAIFFETDKEDDFINVLQSVFENKKYWKNKRKDIVSFCKVNYSTNAMANVFINLIK